MLIMVIAVIVGAGIGLWAYILSDDSSSVIACILLALVLTGLPLIFIHWNNISPFDLYERAINTIDTTKESDLPEYEKNYKYIDNISRINKRIERANRFKDNAWVSIYINKKWTYLEPIDIKDYIEE